MMLFASESFARLKNKAITGKSVFHICLHFKLENNMQGGHCTKRNPQVQSENTYLMV